MKKIEYIIHDALATITLANPAKHNAIDSDFLAEFNTIIDAIASNDKISVVLIKAQGKNFCAGANLKWIQDADVTPLAVLLNKLYYLNKTVITRVHGRSFGGALGLLACSDLVIASENSKFCFSEVKLGLIPAIIAPFMQRAIGMRALRHLMLSAQEFAARYAQQINLVHKIVPNAELNNIVEESIKDILASSSYARAKTKELLLELDNQHQIDEKLLALVINKLHTVRQHPDTKARIEQFLK